MLVHILREYNINKILLSYCGLWPFQKKFLRYLLTISIIVLETSGLLLEILTLYDHWDKQLIFEIFHFITALMMFITKIFNEFWNYDKVLRLYQAMENHWNIFTNEFEMCILKDYAMLSRKFAIVYATMIYVAITIYVIVPLQPMLFDIIWPLNESRPRYFPMLMKLRIDMDKYYAPIYCYHISILFVGMAIMSGVDSIYIARIFHSYGLFSIVNQQFEMIPKPDNNMKVSKYCECCINTNDNKYCIGKHKSEIEEVIYQEYVICLKKYQISLEFVSLLNSTYHVGTFVMLLLNIMLFSLEALQFVYRLDEIEIATKSGITIMTTLMHLMLYCYSGQILMDKSQNVFYQVYDLEWYALSLRFKSMILITLSKSITPCRLTAGIFSLSMATYAAMLRAGISYFTTFLSLKG